MTYFQRKINVYKRHLNVTKTFSGDLRKLDPNHNIRAKTLYKRDFRTLKCM